jgi:23S rRNA (guanosine2251-2'-O)-methyltransferase
MYNYISEYRSMERYSKKSGKQNNRREVKASVRELDDNTVVGRNALKELLASERDIEKIFIKKGELEGSLVQLVGIAKERKIPIVEVDKQKLDSLSCGINNQGVVAIASERNYSSIEEILAYAEEKGEKPFVIVLDGVEDPHNLGAIIRSAECTGAHGVIIPKRRAVGLTGVVERASAGALEHMRVAKVTNLNSAIDELKKKGLWIFAADMGGEAYYDTDMTCAAAIVLGSEGFGISRLVKENCDITVSIPLKGQVNSMNVSCAAAVILSEVSRQRSSK